jgi:3-oxoacyl-(acyl-carrier-protein) synthase
MSRIFVAGAGAVSPAGWNVAALRLALEKGEPIPAMPVVRPGWTQPLRARLVPPAATRPDFLAHPRMRRGSPITHCSASAALEATAGIRANSAAGDFRLGLVGCWQSGCVQYSCRFYDETLKDPATASPLVFPETVYAAPASHVASLMGNVVQVSSLVGDSSVYLQGIALAALWLAEGKVDACVVVGGEETHWTIADALRHFDADIVVSAGAGALCLVKDAALSMGVELAAVTDAQVMTTRQNRVQAAQAMRRQLGAAAADELLADGLGNGPRFDAAEADVWRDWTGQRVSLKRVLGDGMVAGAAWQCVAACDAVAARRVSAANVSVVGFNQQAIGARFVRG